MAKINHAFGIPYEVMEDYNKEIKKNRELWYHVEMLF
jgi:hypothetical protein